MAVPWGAIIAAGATVAGQGGSAYAQGKSNEKTRRFNNWMYDKQREHALADQAMLNDYNSPEKQMQRFKDAGLNPNLIYGQQNEGAAVRSSSPGSHTERAPEFDGGAVMGAYVNTKVQQANLDNLKAQNTVLIQEAALKKAQEISTNVSTAESAQRTARSKFDLDLASDLRNNSLQAAQLGVKKQEADIQYTLDNNERQAALNSSNLKEAAMRIKTMQLQNTKVPAEIRKIEAEIQNIKKSGQLMDLDINLKKIGVQPGDPIYMRALGQILSGTEPKQKRLFMEGIKKGWNQLGF